MTLCMRELSKYDARDAAHGKHMSSLQENEENKMKVCTGRAKKRRRSEDLRQQGGKDVRQGWGDPVRNAASLEDLHTKEEPMQHLWRYN